MNLRPLGYERRVTPFNPARHPNDPSWAGRHRRSVRRGQFMPECLGGGEFIGNALSPTRSDDEHAARPQRITASDVRTSSALTYRAGCASPGAGRSAPIRDVGYGAVVSLS
jgi:hypothetical protein